MKRTVPSDRLPARLAIPAQVADGFAGLAARLHARSQLLWDEHCTECDYPACYKSCAFYSPRADFHCRRFEAGIETVDAAPGLTRIRFRKWGKLEAWGPATLRSPEAAAQSDRVETLAAGALAHVPGLFRTGATWRWNELKKRWFEGQQDDRAQAFVVETWASDGRTHPLTVTFLAAEGGAMFQARFEATPAYGRLVLSIAEIAARIDLNQKFLIQIEPVGEAEGREVVFGLVDFAAFTEAVPASVAPAKPHPKAKVVVWDLDETLWEGVLVEQGASGVHLRPEAVAAIKALDERGIIQSIASKNDHAEAETALKAFGLWDYFLHPQIHWSPKSGSFREIAARLDLGLDSFVFVDDQPFERAEVTETLPSVRALPHTAVADMPGHDWFDVPVTPESRGRRDMYRAEAHRSAAADTAGGDYLGFLRSSGIALDIRPLSEADKERVYELSQRTNQLNFGGTKFSRDEVAGLAAGVPGLACLTLRCADRFGDYGLIGFAVLDLKAGRLAEFFMSCRVQRKRVEHAAFAHMARLLREAGHVAFDVRFRRTDRNKASVALLTELGFSAGADETGWARPLMLPFPDADVVSLTGPDASAVAA